MTEQRICPLSRKACRHARPAKIVITHYRRRCEPREEADGRAETAVEEQYGHRAPDAPSSDDDHDEEFRIEEFMVVGTTEGIVGRNYPLDWPKEATHRTAEVVLRGCGIAEEFMEYAETMSEGLVDAESGAAADSVEES